jgi:CDP-glycerol glycerophosphotransferase (TagB/SpsB family)
MVTHPSKYIVSGAPRNDLLFLSNGKSNMKRIYGDQIDGYKTILFMPTFRKDSNVNLSFKSIESLFGFDQFSLESFDQFLEANNCKLIFKPHPHAEDVVFRLLDNYSLSNLLVLKNEDLVKNSLDLYELINATEMLITDYSSVFYDYLLIDRPIIFTPTDINSYEQDRGFVIESFASWIPGPKAVTQDELQVEITNCLLETDYYADKRAWLRDLNHRYKDGNSSDRLWSFIEKIMPTH